VLDAREGRDPPVRDDGDDEDRPRAGERGALRGAGRIQGDRVRDGWPLAGAAEGRVGRPREDARGARPHDAGAAQGLRGRDAEGGPADARAVIAHHTVFSPGTTFSRASLLTRAAPVSSALAAIMRSA